MICRFVLVTLLVSVALRSAQPPQCSVREMKQVARVGPGHDWSPDGKLIALSLPDNRDIPQLYLMNPDGTGLRCLTCAAVPGGPAVGLQKGVPHWHPSGRYIFLQVEMPDHPGDNSLSYPGRGRYNDIWATTPEADRWWRLTNLSANRETGVLFPVPSPDGTRLAWAERYAAPPNSYKTLAAFLRGQITKDVWGLWRLKVADLGFDASGGPRLSNVISIATGDATFYEMQAWSPAGDALYFAADVSRASPYVLDILRMDLDSRSVTPVADGPADWEEHLGLSSGGGKVTLMSSECCRFNPSDLASLRAELYLADRDGSNRVQLTHFNTAGFPEYSSTGSIVTRSVWSPDGTQVAFGRGLVNSFESSGQLWVLRFAGACGLQASGGQ